MFNNNIEKIFVPLKGTVQDADFPQILHYIYINRIRGALKIFNEFKKKIIYFDSGKPVYIESNYVKELSLGRILVREGKITLAQLAESREFIKKTSMKQGAALVELGFITPYELHQGLILQAQEKLLDIFKWEDYSYNIKMEKIPEEKFIYLNINLPRIIVEGIKRRFPTHYSLNFLETFFNQIKDSIITRCDDSPYLKDHFEFSLNEIEILSWLKSGSTLNSLLKFNTFNKIELLQTLYAFSILGIIKISEKPIDTEGDTHLYNELPKVEFPTLSSSYNFIYDNKLDKFGRSLKNPSINATNSSYISTNSYSCSSGEGLTELDLNEKKCLPIPPLDILEEEKDDDDTSYIENYRIVENNLNKKSIINKEKKDSINFKFIDKLEHQVKYITPYEGEVIPKKESWFKKLWKKSKIENEKNLLGYIASITQPQSFITEQYRTLAIKLEQLNKTHDYKTIMITSAFPKEGKSITAINLAYIMAYEKKKVLLLDCNFRYPKVNSYLMTKPNVGLSDFLSGNAKLEDVIFKYKLENFYIISSGNLTSNSIELLSSNLMKELIKIAKETFDYTIIDAPSIIPFADVPILNQITDGTLFVIKAEKTPKSDVIRAMNLINSERILGIILNNVTNNIFQRRYEKILD